MSRHFERRVQRIAALLGCPIGYSGPEGTIEGPEGAARVELVHPTGRPAAWLVEPSLSMERRQALVALTSERLSVVAALEKVSKRPTLEVVLACLSDCEQRVLEATTPWELTKHLVEGLRRLLALVDSDDVEVEVVPIGDGSGVADVQLDAGGHTIVMEVGAEGQSRWGVQIRRSPEGAHREAAVLNRNHTSACDLFRRQFSTSLRAWHLDRIERAAADLNAAFLEDWNQKDVDPASRHRSFPGAADALRASLGARGVRIRTLHRATLEREVRGEAGVMEGKGFLKVSLKPERAIVADGDDPSTCLPIGDVEIFLEREEDAVGWRSVAHELAVRLADALCHQRRLRLVERALEPPCGRVSQDPWQVLVTRMRADLALSLAGVVEQVGGELTLITSAGEAPEVDVLRKAFAVREAGGTLAEGWQRWACYDYDVWSLRLPGAPPHQERHLVLAARRDAEWPPEAPVLRRHDLDFARHVLEPFLAQLQTLDAIPHAAILLRGGDPGAGVANVHARELLHQVGDTPYQEEIVRKMADASAAPGLPAWVPVDGLGLLVWRPTGTAQDLLLFSPLDGMLALDRALTLERLTSTSFLHYLRTLVNVIQKNTSELRGQFTHGAVPTIGVALRDWPPALPDAAALFERLLARDRAGDATLVVQRWRDLGFDRVEPRLLELVAAVRTPEASFAWAEQSLLRALDGSAAPEVLADALLRMTQIAHHLRGVEASLRQLDANRKLLDGRDGLSRERSLRFLLEDVEDMAQVMAGLEQVPITLSFFCAEDLPDHVLPHARLLEHALLNLVANAIQAVAKSGGGRVRVSMTRRDGDLHVEVEDDGGPLPPQIAAAPYLPPSADAAARGWGLHLTFAIASRLGGRMPLPTLTMSEGDPSRQQKTFVLVLPLPGAAAM